MPRCSPSPVAFLVLLASCFCLSEAAWGTTPLVVAQKRERTVVGERPFKEQSGGELKQGSTALLGRKGAAADLSEYAVRGHPLGEQRKEEGSGSAFLGSSEATKSDEVTGGEVGASEERFLEQNGESEVLLQRGERSPYVKTEAKSRAKPSWGPGQDKTLLAGEEATPVEALTSSGDDNFENRGGESEAGTERAEEEEAETGWRTWGWFAKPKVIKPSESVATSPLPAVVTGRANSPEAERLVADVGDDYDEEFEGGKEEEGMERSGRDVDVEDSEAADGVTGGRMANLRAVILDSVARAIKGGNASEAEKMLSQLFSKEGEAANATTVAGLSKNSTFLSGARPVLDSAAPRLKRGATFLGVNGSAESEAKSSNERTSVWSRFVGRQEESSDGKTEENLARSVTSAARGSASAASIGSEMFARRAANTSESEVVSATKSGGFWGRLVGGADKGSGNEAREELLAEPEEETVGAAAEKEEKTERTEEGLLWKSEKGMVGEFREREGKEREGPRKGPGGEILGSVVNVDGLAKRGFGEDGQGGAASDEVEVKGFADSEEEGEEGDKESALADWKRVGLGNLTGGGLAKEDANVGDRESVVWDEGELGEVPGLGEPSLLNVTTEVARLVPGAGNATLNATRNATSFRNASAPGGVARLVAAVQAQTTRLMHNITRLTPHAGWGFPLNGSAQNASNGTVPLESDASAVHTQDRLGQAQTHGDEAPRQTGLALDLDLDEGLAQKGGTSWSAYDEEDDPPFAESMFDLGAVQKQAKEHLVPHVQALSQATSGAYDSTHAQIRTTLDGVVGPKASGATATFILMLLLLVPGAAVVVLCQRLKTVFSLQMFIFVCCAYLALHSAVLALTALAYKDPLALFQRYSPGAYVMLQFLSLLAYVIFLALCTVSCLAAFRTGELLQRVLGAGQLVPAIGVGVHYFGAVWQPAMVDKPPHLRWTGYGVYTLAFMCLCGVTWFRRSRHEVLASGGSAYKQM